VNDGAGAGPRHPGHRRREHDAPSGRSLPTVALKACDCAFAIQCPDDETATLLDVAFGALLIPSTAGTSIISASLRVERGGPERSYRIQDADGGSTRIADADALLFHLDKWLTIALQRQRSELYFVHAAAVADGGRVAILAAPSTTGKSTLTLALLERGFVYLSDELAPIDLPTRRVYPYARAVSLKSAPPDPVRLPSTALAVGRRFHIPARLFSTHSVSTPLPLAAFIFLRRVSGAGTCSIRISPAAGAAYLAANALNALAHPNAGLDVAVRLAQSVPCFEMNTSDLRAACDEVSSILRALRPTSG
jgi:hypothetical protein